MKAVEVGDVGPFDEHITFNFGASGKVCLEVVYLCLGCKGDPFRQAGLGNRFSAIKQQSQQNEKDREFHGMQV